MSGKDDFDILLYDNSDDDDHSGSALQDDEDDNFVFLDHVKREQQEVKANSSLLGKRRRRSCSETSLLLSPGYSPDGSQSPLPSPLMPSHSVEHELEDLERFTLGEDGHKPSAKRKKLGAAALRARAAEAREYRCLLRALSSKHYRSFQSECGIYPPRIHRSLGFAQCWPWEGYRDRAPGRVEEEIVIQQPLRVVHPEVRSIAQESPWKQVPLSSLKEVQVGDVSLPRAGSPSLDAEVGESSEDGFMEPVRVEVANMVARSFQTALDDDCRSQELTEDSLSVQATTAVVTESLEDLLKATLSLRGLVGPGDMLSSKVAGDWETVLNAAKCIGLPPRVIDRTRLRLFADRNSEELMKLSCFTEMQWIPVPGGLDCNRLGGETRAEEPTSDADDSDNEEESEEESD